MKILVVIGLALLLVGCATPYMNFHDQAYMDCIKRFGRLSDVTVDGVPGVECWYPSQPQPTLLFRQTYHFPTAS